MLRIIVLISLGALSYSAVHFQRYNEKPVEFAYQDGCYIPELKRVLPYDEPYRPANGKPCAMYICNRSNETQIDTCGNSVVPDGCHRVPPPVDETTAENCCGIIKCENSNED